MGDAWRRGWQDLGWRWVRGAKFSLPQAPLKKVPLGGLLNQGTELEEDIPDPEELDWWSKYYASLQELQGQVGAEQGKWQEEGAHQTWSSTVFQSASLQSSFLIFTRILEAGDH